MLYSEQWEEYWENERPMTVEGSFTFLELSEELPQSALTVVVPAGLRRKRELLRFLATAFRFPAYFGENWDALEECLRDLSWLGPPTDIVLAHRDLPLARAPRSLATYLEILLDLARPRDKWHIVFRPRDQQQIARTLQVGRG